MGKCLFRLVYNLFCILIICKYCEPQQTAAKVHIIRTSVAWIDTQKCIILCHLILNFEKHLTIFYFFKVLLHLFHTVAYIDVIYTFNTFESLHKVKTNEQDVR